MKRTPNPLPDANLPAIFRGLDRLQDLVAQVMQKSAKSRPSRTRKELAKTA